MSRPSALNYAAQAERGLGYFLSNNMMLTSVALRKSWEYKLVPKDRAGINAILLAIRHADARFSLPEDGQLFDDGFKGLDGTELNLPYPLITLEFLGKNGDKYAVSASEQQLLDEDEPEKGTIPAILITGARLPGKGVHWQPMLYSGAIAKDAFIGLAAEFLENRRIPIFRPKMPCVGLYTELEKTEGADKLAKQSMAEIRIAIRAVLELCEALTCYNVREEVIQRADAKVNARRVRDGKLPIYETRMLMVDPVAPRRGGAKGDGAGKGTGKPVLLRRGHYRHFDSEYWTSSPYYRKRIWINAIAKAEPGKAVYAVKAPPK